MKKIQTWSSQINLEDFMKHQPNLKPLRLCADLITSITSNSGKKYKKNSGLTKMFCYKMETKQCRIKTSFYSLLPQPITLVTEFINILNTVSFCGPSVKKTQIEPIWRYPVVYIHHYLGTNLDYYYNYLTYLHTVSNSSNTFFSHTFLLRLSLRDLAATRT